MAGCGRNAGNSWNNLAGLPRRLEATAGTRNLDDSSRRAYELLSSSATRDAFNVSAEPQKTLR